MVVSAGHSVGNHTFNHLQGFKVRSGKYVENVELADSYIRSNLFRPPHGHLRIRQGTKLSKKFRFVMWDVITRDYNMKLSGEYVLNVVKRYARNGSIIVFHDSIKAEENMKYALPKAIEFLLSEGYKFEKITEEEILKAI
jgi:peptidoglycan/xylan/chitin deacetylase (PgdA/CDA1 family)